MVVERAVDGSSRESTLRLQEDGCVLRLTPERFKALTSSMANTSPLQIRLKVDPSSDPPFPSLARLEGVDEATVTINWVEDTIPIHPTGVHVGPRFDASF